MLERPNVLRVGDRVVFGGSAHTVVALSGMTVRLLAASGATTVVALPYLLAAEDFELVGAAPPPKVSPHGLIDALPAHVVEAARVWERHLVEVTTGLPPDAPEGASPRPEYDPVTQPIGAREKAKAAETIKRLLSNLATITQGVAELRNHYGTGHGKVASAKGLQPRHAKLAAGAASTLAVFLAETHNDRPRPKVRG